SASTIVTRGIKTITGSPSLPFSVRVTSSLRQLTTLRMSEKPISLSSRRTSRKRRLAIIMLIADDADGQARITALREGLEKLGWTAHNGTWQCAPRRNSAVHTH